MKQKQRNIKSNKQNLQANVLSNYEGVLGPRRAVLMGVTSFGWESPEDSESSSILAHFLFLSSSFSFWEVADGRDVPVWEPDESAASSAATAPRAAPVSAASLSVTAVALGKSPPSGSGGKEERKRWSWKIDRTQKTNNN
jgi:hypothetical protein